MKRGWNSISIFGFLVMTTIFLNAQTESPVVDWKGLEETWTAYFNAPSEEGAGKILDRLPAMEKISDVRDGLLVIDSIQQHLGVLEGEIYSGNPNAIRVGFRLYTISYGNFEAGLDKILGNLIAFHPRIFLEELDAHRRLLTSLDQVLGSYLREISDDKTAREQERKLRIQSLESVEEKPLKPLRNECLKILKKL